MDLESRGPFAGSRLVSGLLSAARAGLSSGTGHTDAQASSLASATAGAQHNGPGGAAQASAHGAADARLHRLTGAGRAVDYQVRPMHAMRGAEEQAHALIKPAPAAVRPVRGRGTLHARSPGRRAARWLGAGSLACAQGRGRGGAAAPSAPPPTP